MEENIMNIKSQIKAQILLAGFTMAEAVDALSTDYGWSDSLSNFSAKLSRYVTLLDQKRKILLNQLPEYKNLTFAKIGIKIVT